MTNYFLIYEDCCFYEIVLLGYFMRYSGCGKQSCAYCLAESQPRKTSPLEIRTAEGFRVNADLLVKDIDPGDVKSLIIPGGDISHARSDALKALLLSLDPERTCIGAICAGVTLLEEYGLLEGRNTIRTSSAAAVRDGLLITARPNGYVDFAVEAGQALGLFTDEEDIRETVNFFKYHQSVEE